MRPLVICLTENELAIKEELSEVAEILALEGNNVIHLTIVPFLIGKKALPAIVDGDSEFLHFAEKRWNLTHCEKLGDEIFLRYERYTLDTKD